MNYFDEIANPSTIALRTVKPKRVWLPRFAWVKLSFPSPKVEDVPNTVRNELEQAFVAANIRPGMQVAIAVGSRGVADLVTIVRTVVEELKRRGTKPFIVPAMGSHGGATAKGQSEVLHALGVTPDTVGTSMRSSMQVVKLGETDEGVPLFMDRNAYQADAIIVVNRVREHTDFNGPVQSGLMKMVSIGLGKASGATAIHERGAAQMHIQIPKVARGILERLPMISGLAVVENADCQVAAIRCALPDNFEAVDRNLLLLSQKLTPRLPVDELDVLVVRDIGKDISGFGMDSKTVGRIRIPGVPEPDRPRIARIAALDLTPASHGNATGLCLSDVTTQRLVSKINFQAFYVNQLACGHLQGAIIPMVLASEREALEVVMGVGWMIDPGSLRAIIIQDTKKLGRILVSEVMLPDFEKMPGCEVESTPFALSFNREGDLIYNNKSKKVTL